MAGAAKQRQKKERDAAAADKREKNLASSTAPVQLPPKLRGGYDGPGDSSTGGPPSRGRPESSAPSVGQPGRAPPRGPSQGPSQGPPSSTGGASSQIRGPSQVRGTSSRMLPDRTGDFEARRYAARFIDLPANAYTIGGLGNPADKVSPSLPDFVIVDLQYSLFAFHSLEFTFPSVYHSLCLVLLLPSITDCITIIS